MSPRWFRRLLRLLPDDFQADYARDMERTFEAQQREARGRGLSPVLALWWRTVGDLLRIAPREHLDVLRQDAAYAMRQFAGRPLFSGMAVTTIAVGIAANAATFGVVHAVLLAPLPFPEPGRLVRIHESYLPSGLLRNSASAPNVLDWQQQSSSFDGIAAYRRRSINVAGTGEPRYVHGARASASFFRLLGVSPVHGRLFTEAEDREVAKVAVISHALWQSQFGRDPAVLGKPLDVDGGAYTVIGVLPSDFRFHLASEIWIPLGLYPGVTAGRGSHSLNVLARLRPGVALDAARAEMSAIAARLEREHPATNTGWTVFVEPLLDSGVHQLRAPAFVLLAAVAFVLLAACANIGGLLVARAAGRGGEFAVRVALGASRGRLVRQLLTEAALLAAAGGASGLLLAAPMIEAVRRFTAFEVPRLENAGLHPPVVMAVAGLTMFTAVVFGMLPAVHVGRRNQGARLRHSSRAETSGRERLRMQSLLNAAQLALAVVLLAGTGVMIQTLLRLGAVDLGFDPSGVIAVDLSLSDSRYPAEDDAIAFFRKVVSEVASVPGFERVSLVSDPPLTGGAGLWSVGFTVEGRAPKPPGQGDFAYQRLVTPEYFDLLRVPLVRGRMFTGLEAAGPHMVVVVNAVFARRFFPNQDPIGQRIVISARQARPREIIGVVGDIRQTSADAEPEPQMYVPAYQAVLGAGTLLVRTDAPFEASVRAVGEAVRRVDPRQPIFNARPMAADVAASTASRRIVAQVLALFAFVAVGLALLGVYAVAAYQVNERTREFGVRMALGAREREIVRLVVREGMGPACAGVAIGLGAAAVLTRFLRSLLFETEPLEPAAFGAAAAALLASALMACLVPARRATRVDPAASLRGE